MGAILHWCAPLSFCTVQHILFAYPWVTTRVVPGSSHHMGYENNCSASTAGILLLAHFGCSLLIVMGNRSTAQKKNFVQNDLEYSTLSSILIVCSLQQVVASAYLIWFVATGFNWSKSPHAFGGVLYVIGLCASFMAGVIGMKVSSLHLFSDENLLVRCYCRILDVRGTPQGLSFQDVETLFLNTSTETVPTLFLEPNSKPLDLCLNKEPKL